MQLFRQGKLKYSTSSQERSARYLLAVRPGVGVEQAKFFPSRPEGLWGPISGLLNGLSSSCPDGEIARTRC
jgi:hypothetical protein